MLVRVKEHYQVTIPAALRRQANISEGDVLEAKVKNGRITFCAQTFVDREIALALKEKSVSFNSMEEAIAHLHRSAKEARKRRRNAR